MTREQVKQELKELKNILTLFRKGISADDTKGLKKKYDEAMKHLDFGEQTILFNYIYLGETQFKIAMLLNYSDETIRKKYSKIIDKLANIVEIKKTNFERITESVESLAEFISKTTECYFCSVHELYGVAKCQGEKMCAEILKEWLQKECEG